MTKKHPVSIYEGETEISPDILKEYIEYHNLINIGKYDYVKVISLSKEDLFSRQTPAGMKKKLLFLLGHFATNDCFKILKNYIDDPKIDMNEWAVLAMQDLRLKVENEIFTDGKDMVISQVGGKENKLRFYAVVSSKHRKLFSEKEKSIIEKELSFVTKKKDSEVKSIEFGNGYALIKMLISINIAPAEIFDSLLDICSKKLGILRYHYFLVNTHKITKKEIADYLNEVLTNTRG